MRAQVHSNKLIHEQCSLYFPRRYAFRQKHTGCGLCRGPDIGTQYPFGCYTQVPVDVPLDPQTLASCSSCAWGQGFFGVDRLSPVLVLPISRKSHSGATTTARAMHSYRVYAVSAEDQTDLPPRIIWAEDDHEAVQHARMFLDGRRIEVWHGERFVARIGAEE